MDSANENPSTYTECFQDVQKAELEHIRSRRECAKLSEDQKRPDDDTIGLALSGGGIRSATFNLGILQALGKADCLRHFDYLSTVSGGGYIGSAWIWLKSRFGAEFEARTKAPTGADTAAQAATKPEVSDVFPFGASRAHNKGLQGRIVSWLRAHGNFLTPGGKLNKWALSAALLSGTTINLLVLLPLFHLVFFLLARRYCYPAPDSMFANIAAWFGMNPAQNQGFIAFMGLGLLSLALLFLLMLFSVFSSNSRRFRELTGKQSLKFRRHRFEVTIRGHEGGLLAFVVFFFAVGSIPLAYEAIIPSLEKMISGISLGGALSFIGGLFKRKPGDGDSGLQSFLLTAGLSLMVYGLFLWLYHLTAGFLSADFGAAIPTWLLGALVVSTVLAFSANINHVSMHRYYRNRLMEAYMPRAEDLEPKHPDTKKATVVRPSPAEDSPCKQTNATPDRFLLSGIPVTSAPYQIINTNLQTVGSQDPKLKGRGGENFILSKEYCGSNATGFLETKRFAGGWMNLATAFSISGAAVDPNSYATRSKPLSFVMSLLNIRLGYWAPNPKYHDRTVIKPLWYYYIFRDMFGNGLNEDQRKIHLSDGGHFENLGLYELIRRKCRRIVVCDAGADPDFKFGDLGKVIERVRVDFGAHIDIKTDSMRPAGDDKVSTDAIVEGTVQYDSNNPGDTGKIWYVKTCRPKDLPEDILSFWRNDDQFPDDTTADQFFDERQFEAYRELGYLIGRKLCNEKSKILERFDPEESKKVA